MAPRAAVLVTLEDGKTYRIEVLRRPLPRRGGTHFSIVALGAESPSVSLAPDVGSADFITVVSASPDPVRFICQLATSTKGMLAVLLLFSLSIGLVAAVLARSYPRQGTAAPALPPVVVR